MSLIAILFAGWVFGAIAFAMIPRRSVSWKLVASSRESKFAAARRLGIVVIVARPQEKTQPPILISRAANSEHGTSQRI